MANFLHTALKNALIIAKRAGTEILKYRYATPEHALQISQKSDHSLVTAADLAAHRCITAGLLDLFPDIPRLSEEDDLEKNSISRRTWTHYWLIDPLDGTRGFIAHSPQFTVNIALIDEGRPIIGVIYAPALDQCYYAAKSIGAFSQVGTAAPVSLHTQSLDWTHYRIAIGHYSSPTRWLKNVQKSTCHIMHCHSSLKIAWIAAGLADLYPRRGATSEWDTAAGQCILEQAGGALVDFSGQPLQYNASASLINPPFVALGDISEAKAIVALLNSQEK